MRYPHSHYFDPNLIANLALWVDADDASTITDASGYASQVMDKGPTGYAFTAIDGERPAIVSGAHNGRQTLRFDGSNDTLVIGTNNLCRFVAGATLFMVLKYDPVPGSESAQTPFFIATNSGTARLSTSGAISGTKWNVGGRRADTNSFKSLNSTAGITTDLAIHGGVWDYANSDLYQYLNGSQDGFLGAFQTIGSTSNTASTGCGIGGPPADVGQKFQGDICEVILYHRSLSAVERLRIEMYLRTKWGITS